jgi:uncharacterized protein (TIGR00369 family)
MSAVEVYQQVLDAVDFYEYLGLTFVEAKTDEDICRMQIPDAETLRTPVGHVHGGVLTSVMDMAGLFAVWREYGTPGGKAYTTAMDVSFEKSATQGVTAHAVVRDRTTSSERDELAIEVELFELPDTHEFGMPYDPENDPESTLVARSRLEFVMLDDRAVASTA